MSEHKKYKVFQYDSYYPCGGIEDCYVEFDILEDAIEYIKSNQYDYNYIIDRDTWETVFDLDNI
jgi:hypothetical protein